LDTRGELQKHHLSRVRQIGSIIDSSARCI